MESCGSLTPSARNTRAAPAFLACNDDFVEKGDEQGKPGKNIFLLPFGYSPF